MACKKCGMPENGTFLDKCFCEPQRGLLKRIKDEPTDRSADWPSDMVEKARKWNIDIPDGWDLMPLDTAIQKGDQLSFKGGPWVEVDYQPDGNTLQNEFYLLIRKRSL